MTLVIATMRCVVQCNNIMLMVLPQPKFSKEQFDEVFEAALKDLVDHEDVIESIDVK